VRMSGSSEFFSRVNQKVVIFNSKHIKNVELKNKNTPEPAPNGRLLTVPVYGSPDGVTTYGRAQSW